MTDKPAAGDTASTPPLPSLEELQHWTQLMGRAQQMMLEHSTRLMGEAGTQAAAAMEKAMAPGEAAPFPAFSPSAGWPNPWTAMFPDPSRLASAQMAMWGETMALWQRAFNGETGEGELRERADKDRRFNAPQWRDKPLFDMIRQSYLLASDQLLGSVDTLEGIDDRTREKLRFSANAFVDAMSPSHFVATNPVVLEKTIATKGENLLKGLENMLGDLGRGQLTHTDREAFEVGRNIAVTPGKVIHETPLYQLIQYSPTTDKVLATPVVIFPPWINRFYILDLNPKKSFVRWAVEQGLTVFMVSWKSADESLVDVMMDDYVTAQIDAVDTIRDALGVDDVHTIGYCVAGTTLAATLALLAARKELDKVASATFFTAQVDFSEAGDLNFFLGDEQMQLIQTLSAQKGFLDGRYMAATFNLLRGRDLIWSYVTNNYLMGEEYAPFDLLHWNGDTTNLPAKWHQAYLKDLYSDNKLAIAGGISIMGKPIDLSKVTVPTYVQAGREDHIAPPQSVWKITHHFTGPLRFVLAGSGHIAGVVNPPEAGKYQYWTNDKKAASLDEFVAGAKETPGSWWPDWLGWIKERSAKTVPATGARQPGKGKKKAIEDAPGRYVKAR